MVSAPLPCIDLRLFLLHGQQGVARLGGPVGGPGGRGGGWPGGGLLFPRPEGGTRRRLSKPSSLLLRLLHPLSGNTMVGKDVNAF